MSIKLDWLIIGGGIHGVHIAARLLGESGVAPDRLRILDPCDRLLARWRNCAAATGMTHLRSPGVHHLDLDLSAETTTTIAVMTIIIISVIEGTPLKTTSAEEVIVSKKRGGIHKRASSKRNRESKGTF